jgi:DNA-binding transcriptional regulator YdaS (Cro superfamily)
MAREQTPTGIEQAVANVGTQTELATRLGVTQQVVSVWLRRGWVPLYRAAEIEHHTGISRQSLIKPRWRELLELPGG